MASRLESIIRQLQSKDAEERRSARAALHEVAESGLTEKEGRLAIVAATDSFPEETSEWDNASICLVAAVSDSPYRSHIDVVAENFPRYRTGAKFYALILLARLSHEKAARTYMTLLPQYLHAKTGEGPLPQWPLEHEPKHPNVFFPALLEVLRPTQWKFDGYRLLYSYLRAGVLNQQGIAEYHEPLLGEYLALEEFLKRSQRDSGMAWMWQDEYRLYRSNASLLLDLLGYIKTSAGLDALWRACEFVDPRLQVFAVLSLSRRGVIVKRETLLKAASSAESRNLLYRELAGLGKKSLFPEEFATQAALAESDMVEWLTDGRELDQAPEEIQLIGVFPVSTPEGPGECYLYRFRTFPPHFAAENGWMAGCAGPFLLSKTPTTESLGGTFSKFRRWDEMKPDEHVADILDLGTE